MSTVSLFFTPQEVETYSRNMEDPVAYQPLKDAVVLVPCGHSLSKEIAEEIFKKMSVQCPECRQSFFMYVPNFTVRRMEAQAHKIATMIANPLVNPLKQPPTEKPKPLLPFPGNKASFMYMPSPPWRGQDLNRTPLIRIIRCQNGPHESLWSSTASGKQITFNSQTPHSFLKMVTVHYHHNGTLIIAITCRPCHIETFRTFLFQSNMLKASYHFNGCFSASRPCEHHFALRFLEENNTFPSNAFPYLRQLVMGKVRNSNASVH